MNVTPVTVAPSVVAPSALDTMNPFQKRILFALNFKSKHVFAGIDPAEKARRRKAGKAQRAARKAARG